MAEKRIEPGPLATQVARSIRRIREERRITYAELSERLAALGRTIPVLGLSRMEKGDRRVDLDDLVAVARALDVPPIWLLFPLDKEAPPDIELAPGERVPMQAAMSWFVGDREAFYDYFGGGNYDSDSGLFEWYDLPEAIRPDWVDEVRPLSLYRQHRRYVLEWFETWSRPRLDAAGDKPVGEFVFTLAALTEERLRAVRKELRRLGLPLPPLPPSSLRDRMGPDLGGEGGGPER